MEKFEGIFEFFCHPTKTADNKKTVVELTGNYDLEEFCKAQSFWDETIKMKIIKEELKETGNFKEYGFTVLIQKPNKGSKDTKTYTIYLSKSFDHDEHLELDDFLYQPVFVEWVSVQPDINFEKKEDSKNDDFKIGDGFDD